LSYLFILISFEISCSLQIDNDGDSIAKTRQIVKFLKIIN